MIKIQPTSTAPIDVTDLPQQPNTLSVISVDISNLLNLKGQEAEGIRVKQADQEFNVCLSSFQPDVSKQEYMRMRRRLVCAVKRVPTPGGKLDVSYLKKWSRMLNFLADTGIWVATLEPMVLVPLASGSVQVDAGPQKQLPERTLISSFLITNLPVPEVQMGLYRSLLNSTIGWPGTFVEEGDMGLDNWNEFPF